MGMAERNERPKRRKRSPEYPGIGLDQAIKLARILSEKEGKNATPVDVVVDHWGYSPGSGPGNTVLSALRKFGLVSYQGKGDDRRVKLTDFADDILWRETNEPERIEALQSAALRPKIHFELWEQYGADLPSSKTLKMELVREYGFNPSVVDDFIGQYRETLEFAELLNEDNIPKEPSETQEFGAKRHRPRTETSRSEAAADVRAVRIAGESFAIPVSSSKRLQLTGPFPLTEAEWDRAIAFLTLMKETLTSSTAREGTEEENAVDDVGAA